MTPCARAGCYAEGNCEAEVDFGPMRLEVRLCDRDAMAFEGIAAMLAAQKQGAPPAEGSAL